MNERLDNLLKKYFSGFFGVLNVEDKKQYYKNFVRDITDGVIQSQKDILEYINKTGIFNNKKILVLGAGAGSLERAYALKNPKSDCTFYGIEPCFTGSQIARELYPKNKKPSIHYIQGVGETFPFPNNTFDAVISNQVMEHVRDISKVAEEIYRVIKPGGLTYHLCPNYRAFHEGHYRIFWLPIISKPVIATYLKLRGYPTGYLWNELNLLTAGDLYKKFLKAGFENVDVKCLQKNILQKLEKTQNLTGTKKNILKLLKNFKIFRILKLIIQYYPFFRVIHLKAKKPI